MLVTNQQLDKLAAARVDFFNRGMLDPKNQQHQGVISVAMDRRENRCEDEDEIEEAEQPATGPSETAEVPMVTGTVTLARTRSMFFFHTQSGSFLTDFSYSPPLPTIPGGTRSPY